jgi:hypothetical protein
MLGVEKNNFIGFQFVFFELYVRKKYPMRHPEYWRVD